MTNEQKHEMFKREISASIIESASWNDRPMEEQKMKKVTVETFGEVYPEPETV